MIGSYSTKTRVWVWREAVDMRKSYDGLAGLARTHRNLLSGDMFLFMSRNRKRAKVLMWDGTGLNIWMKRLERGRFANIFHRPRMTVGELRLFFEGSASVIRRLSPRDLSRRFAA